MIRSRRGSQTIEMLFVLPVLLMLFFMTVEMGFLMYDFVTVNYAAASAAVEAARKGKFDGEVRQEIAAYLHDWTTEGKRFAVDPWATSPAAQNDTIVLWGPDPDQAFERGSVIEVGVVYPVRFKTFLIDGLARWLVQENVLSLKARAAALSEVHFEP